MSAKVKNVHRSPTMNAMLRVIEMNPGSIPEEIADLANINRQTCESYISPLLKEESIHISGWRPSEKFSNRFVREVSIGPQIDPVPTLPQSCGCLKEEPGEPFVFPYDFALAALCGIKQQDHKGVAA